MPNDRPEGSPAELLNARHDTPDPTGPLVDWEPAACARTARERAEALPESPGEPVPVQPGTREEGRLSVDLSVADSEQLGRLVRETWIAWARLEPAPKPSWLLPWELLDDGQREADRRIGAAVARAERERIAAVIQPARLRTLADWFDMDDEFKTATFPGTWPAGSRADEVRQDLRAWADLLEQP